MLLSPKPIRPSPRSIIIIGGMLLLLAGGRMAMASQPIVEARPFGFGVAHGTGDTVPRAEVTVSRREVRVVFPRDTATRWGWPVETVRFSYPYVWSMGLEGMNGYRDVTLTVRADAAPMRFPSLDSLAAAANGEWCIPGMIADCRPAAVHGEVNDGRMMLVFTDSARIAELFATRPASVWVYRNAPGTTFTFQRDGLPVRYVDPAIPIPDSALLERARQGRRAARASVTHTWRTLTAGTGTGGAIVLRPGDTTQVAVEEGWCQEDVCGGGELPSAGEWVVGDTSIAQVVSVRHPSSHLVVVTGYRLLAGLRPGRTTLTVTGVHGLLDTIPSLTPVASTLRREIVVHAGTAQVPRHD
jgi:hypothetical protein